MKVSSTAPFTVLQTFNLCVHQPTKIQSKNLDAISAAISAAVTTSGAVVSCDNDWGFWPPNHSHRAIRIIKMTPTRLQKMVYLSPVHSVPLKEELKKQDILTRRNNESIMKPGTSSRSQRELHIQRMQGPLVEL